jgi:hypothetical protein
MSLAAASAVSACATEYNMQEVEAGRDFVFANQLEEVVDIRFVRQVIFTYGTVYCVVVPARPGDVRGEFSRQCQELRRSDFSSEMVDRRHEPNKLSARYDTIRGCRIAKMYSVSDAQSKELVDLGDAPGDDVYLPEDDQD